MDTVHGEPCARCRRGVGPARARRPRRAKREFWGRGSPLGGGRAEIHQHRHFGYIAAQFGAADDAMLVDQVLRVTTRSEEHTSELQSLMRISYAVFCLQKKQHTILP